ncbi:contractile injection system protein, VgrG/Pvc8 family [Pseudomonas sp. PCH446]
MYQNLPTSDIVTSIFKAHGFSDYELKLSGSYEPREYCIQYGETDFAFVCRLLEEEGIFWFFSHAEGRHTLILADSNSAFISCPNGASIAYLGQQIGNRELQGIRSRKSASKRCPGSTVPPTISSSPLPLRYTAALKPSRAAVSL